MSRAINAVPESERGSLPTIAEPHATLAEAASLPPKLRLRYAAWLRVCGKLDEAALLLEWIENETGESATLLDERAALALAQGDLPALRDCWDRRLAAHPAPSARASFARALLELGELEDAALMAETLVADHGELATIRSLAAEVAMQSGDLATAHDHWLEQLSEDPSRVAPQLALARIALLGGDPDEARATLSRIVADPTDLTAAQLATAAALAEMLGQPGRAHLLRQRFVRLEAGRAAALAAEIDAELGRSSIGAPDGRFRPESGQSDSLASEARPAERSPAAARTDAEPAIEPPDVAAIEEEPLADDRVLQTLRDVFEHPGLLPGQAAVINRLLARRDTLAILPTGAGKSLTFQLSSLLLPGTTLVLSPLIALMKDQVESLPLQIRQRTVLINSTLSPAEQARAVDEIAAGSYKLVYAAPERLRQHTFLRALREAGVSLVVVDEAHCISLWGHDFRPDYLSIPAALPELGDPPLLAMTATASPETAASLAAAFRRELDVVRTSSFRPNLYYAGERLASKEEKARRVIALCRELNGQGIVYVSSRRDAENLAGVLGDNGVRAVAYHAGLEPRVRAANQDRFMRGDARIVVATVAFGMGIDKADVRFIIHFSPSTSLEAYAQESGRAGRDGEDSRCVLLYTSSDRATQTRLARRDELGLDTLRQIYAGIKRHAAGSWAIFDPSRIVLRGEPGIDPDDAPDPRIGIGLLVEGGLLERHPNAPATWTLTPAIGGDASAPPADDEDAAIWERLSAWANLDPSSARSTTLQTAQVCDALDVSPEILARVLETRPGWVAREGVRFPCLHLLPVEATATARLQRVLDAAASRARARVDRTMRYAEGRRCRHAELAAHLGERLDPCGDACDVCTGESANAAEGRMRRERQPRKRTEPTAADALAALNALASAPFPLGKTGLTRLLEGSIQSRIQGDRSSFFGALADLRKSKIEAVIESLVAEGAFIHDRGGAFPVLRLTPDAQRRLREEPESFAFVAADRNTRPSAPDRAASGADDDPELSPDDQDLRERLWTWRRDRAARDGIAAFVVAHNAVLTAIAGRRPGSRDELAAIHGFGASRAEKYGSEILAVVRDGAGSLE